MHSSIRPFITSLLLLVFLAQIFSSAFIYADYFINKDFITKVFCINKDKPQLHCNGKCHLKAQLEKEEKKENSPINSVKEKKELQLFAESNPYVKLENHFIKISRSFHYLISIPERPLTSIFHPPQA